MNPALARVIELVARLPDPVAGLEPAPPRAEPGRFSVLAEAGPARAAVLHTAHGPIQTPCFMPVGTYGAVKGLLAEDLRAVGSQIVLGNAYHLAHRPGAARIAALGGLHRFMGWDGPILTDSGGYQVFSLRSLQRIDDEGVDYRTHFDGSAHRMTPASVLEVQAQLGSDICMVLDHCPPGDASAAEIQAALVRTRRWAERAAALRGSILRPGQLCFGIVQGGTDPVARAESLRDLRELPFDGLALGGLSVGEPTAATHATIAAFGPALPPERPRYVMGIGTPADLLCAVQAGIDLFDCVIPTRHARNGQLMTWSGALNLRHARFRDDPAPIDGALGHPAHRRWSRAYLRHLHEQRDPLYVRIASEHNLWFLHQWVGAMRAALRAKTFPVIVDALSALIAHTEPVDELEAEDAAGP